MTILKMSVMASVLIVLIAIIRRLAINKLPKKVFMILWGIVLCRLIIPFSIPAQMSVPSVPGNVSGFMADSRLVALLMKSPFERETAHIPMQSEKIIENGYLSTIPPYILIWTVGFIVLATFFVVTHLRYVREYKTALPVDHPFINKWLSEQSKQIEIRQSDKILSPLMYGIWKPVILLPKRMDYADEKRLRFVLTHELIHIKRFDTLAKWLLVFTLCIHWFNPLVWFMYILANRDIELSCDEAVLRTFGDKEKSSYAQTLISLAETKNPWILLHSNFSKNSIEERIVAIMKVKKSNVLGAILVIPLVLVTMFATSAGATKNLKALSLFEYVNSSEDIYQNMVQMNDLNGDTAIAITEEYSIYFLNTFFSDEEVYVTVALEGNVTDDPAINGKIVSHDEQMVYELDGKYKELEQEDERRYFFYTGRAADISSFHNQSALLELDVHLNENQYQFQTKVENISTDVFVFQPDGRNYNGDYYETIILTSHGLYMTGLNEKLTDEWVQPDIKITIVRTDDQEINVSHDTRGSISDEGFQLHSTDGYNSETGEFFLDWNFWEWELDLSEVTALIIDDVAYHVH